VSSFRFHSIDEFRLIPGFHLSNFAAHEYGAIGIRLTRISPHAQGLNSSVRRAECRRWRVHDFAVDLHGRADVAPSGNLANRKNVSAAESRSSLALPLLSDAKEIWRCCDEPPEAA